ncbi:putative alcohol dehydrogenase [Xylariaceae sp. AK1471]|nr:putative alcohol dehydrogenase [Xylariaceae sp. AK1471]
MAAATMKQWTTMMDGIDNFKLETVPVPNSTNLKDDEVLVKISRVSLNNRDIQLINGDFKNRYKVPENPLVPCSDASGTVVKVGSTASHQWREGDRVFTLMRPTHLTGPSRPEHNSSTIGIPLPGVLVEYRVFPASALLRVPAYMTLEEACTLTVAATTAWMALNWDQPIGRPRRGKDVVVLLQGTGGVSIAGLQQAKALGLTTIVTSSSDTKLQLAKDLGADYTVNYTKSPDWDAEVLRLTGGNGADIILETGGPGTMDRSLNCVACGGNISAVGILTGSMEKEEGKSKLAIGMRLIQRNATLKGINVGPKDRAEEMMKLYETAHIRPIVDRVFEFGDAQEALRHVRSGSHVGKVVITVD